MQQIFVSILVSIFTRKVVETLLLVSLKEVAKYTTNTVDDKLVAVVEAALAPNKEKEVE